mgnify:CR=1 FL=1
MDPLITLLRSNAGYSHEQLAEYLSLTPQEVAAKIKQLEEQGVILGHACVINPEKLSKEHARAYIEVKVTPERGGGFDRVGERIARFDQVRSCMVLAGAYDLLVVVEGSHIRDIAQFVTEKLSTLDGVISTATHFHLKSYKEAGIKFSSEPALERMSVSP